MILYFSGTGNSKYVAQRMAEALNQSLLSMNDRIRSHDTSPVETDERLVIVMLESVPNFQCGSIGAE